MSLAPRLHSLSGLPQTPPESNTCMTSPLPSPSQHISDFLGNLLCFTCSLLCVHVCVSIQHNHLYISTCSLQFGTWKSQIPSSCSYLHNVNRDGYVGQWYSTLFVVHKAVIAILYFTLFVYFVCLYHPYIFLISLEIFYILLVCVLFWQCATDNTALISIVSYNSSSSTRFYKFGLFFSTRL